MIRAGRVALGLISAPRASHCESNRLSSRHYTSTSANNGKTGGVRAAKAAIPKWDTVRSTLLRDFIAESLYARTESYFTETAPVHDLEAPLPFRSMWGFWAYRNHLYQVFKDVDGFMTPVEIFKPYYAQAIARYIVTVLKRKGLYSESDGAGVDSTQEATTSPISLLEVGAGNGTCAVGILDFIRDHHPKLYSRIRYTIVDVSKAFVERQRRNLAHHGDKVKIINQSVYDYSESDQYPGFVIGLEILDNLPHDKLIVDTIGHIRETFVEEKRLSDAPESHPHVLSEKNHPVRDPVIMEYLKMYARHFGLPSDWIGDTSVYDDKNKTIQPLTLWHYLRRPNTENLRKALLAKNPSIIGEASHFLQTYFTMSALKTALSALGAATGGVSPHRILHVPTGSFSFLKRLMAQHPNKEFILSDFDYIPGAMPGINAPLVQRSEGNVTTAFKSYLDTEPGHCDIFYPTNFDSLRIMYYELSGGKVATAVRSKAFLKEFADYKQTRTRTGYNPILQDFINTKFFLSAPYK